MHRITHKKQNNSDQKAKTDEHPAKPITISETEKINYFADEDSIYYDIAPHHMEIALKNIASSVSSNTHEITKHVTAALHAFADAMNAVHLSGKHLKGALKYAGPIAEVVAEIIHDPSNELIEKLICGTTVAFVKEAINLSIAVEVGVSIGLVSSIVTTPVGGFLAVGTASVATYKMLNQITGPVGHCVQHRCHMMFNHLRAKKHDTGSKNLQNALVQLKQNKLSNKYVPATVTNYIANHFREPKALPDRITPIIAEGLKNHANKPTPSSTKSIMENLNELKTSKYRSNYNKTTFSSPDFSPIRESKPETIYFESLEQAQCHATFWYGYLSGACDYIPLANLFLDTVGINGEANKLRYCDPRTSDCRESGSSTCKSSGFKR